MAQLPTQSSNTAPADGIIPLVRVQAQGAFVAVTEKATRMNLNKFKVVLLDRDGVINEDSDEYIKAPEEWRAIPGSLEAIAHLKRSGVIVCVCSNQSGLARGMFDLATLNAIHMEMTMALAEYGEALDRIYYCPHHPDDNCQCRKPKPGMLQQVQQDFSVSPMDMMFIGDSYTDYEAAVAFGCAFLFVLTGKGEKHREKIPPHVPVFNDLASAIRAIL